MTMLRPSLCAQADVSRERLKTREWKTRDQIAWVEIAFSTMDAIWSRVFQSRAFHPRTCHGPPFSIPAFSASPSRAPGRDSYTLAVPGFRNRLSLSPYSLSTLTAIFQVDLGQPVPERLHSGFYRSYKDAGGGEW